MSDQFRIMTHLPRRPVRTDGPYDSLREATAAQARIQKVVKTAWAREKRAEASQWIERKDEGGSAWMSVGTVIDFEVGK